MTPIPFDSEAVLQELLQRFPVILDGEQFPGEQPRQWVLVAREMAVPDGEGSNRWSLDHLLLDQDGIPTLIEVKRRKDGRSRREVIGQMFDYAANGPSYWPIDMLKTCFEKSCGNPDEAARRLAELLQDQQEPDAYWETVEKNLRNGRLRLIFLLDDVPPELLRIIEFLGRHLKSEVEVYAVEVSQHVGETGKILSTRVLGAKPAASTALTPGRAAGVVDLSIDEWMLNLRKQVSDRAGNLIMDLTNWMRNHGELFTTPAQKPALGMSVLESGRARYPFSISPAGKANIQLCYLAYSEAYRNPTSLRSLVQEAAPMLAIDPSKVNLGGVMGVKLDDLAADRDKYNALIRTLETIVQRLSAPDGVT